MTSVIVEHRFDGRIADCPLPDPEEVFRQAVEYEIGRLPGQEQVLREVTANARPGGPHTGQRCTGW